MYIYPVSDAVSSLASGVLCVLCVYYRVIPFRSVVGVMRMVASRATEHGGLT